MNMAFNKKGFPWETKYELLVAAAEALSKAGQQQTPSGAYFQCGNSDTGQIAALYFPSCQAPAKIVDPVGLTAILCLHKVG